jgi:serine/threonine-protein kinase
MHVVGWTRSTEGPHSSALLGTGKVAQVRQRSHWSKQLPELADGDPNRQSKICSTVKLVPGMRVGPYEIQGSLGAGGMGEVYKAVDTELRRVVALKVLPDQFVSDAERVARFEREATMLASINDPHVAQIYGVARGNDESRVLVMEFVEGDDLAARILRGRLPVDETLAIARQIAAALEAAHEIGIVHRDLKPANIKVRSDGVVKVLDHLSTATEPLNGRAPVRPPTTTSAAMTERGALERPRICLRIGKGADRRPAQRHLELWGVLFEMLSGRAFKGTTPPNGGSVLADTPTGACCQSRRLKRFAGFLGAA